MNVEGFLAQLQAQVIELKKLDGVERVIIDNYSDHLCLEAAQANGRLVHRVEIYINVNEGDILEEG